VERKPRQTESECAAARLAVGLKAAVKSRLKNESSYSAPVSTLLTFCAMPATV
jgi:hypothetical protein